MADDLDGVIRLLRAGQDPGRGAWGLLAGSGRADAVEALVDCLEADAPGHVRTHVLEVLVDLAWGSGRRVLAQPAAVRAVVRAMASEHNPDARADGSFDDVWQHRTWKHQDAPHRFECYQAILEPLRAAAVPSAAEMLEGPPLPVTLEPGAANHGHVPCGAKPVAVKVVRSYGSHAQAPVLRGVVSSLGEAPVTRILAVEAWHHLAGADAVPAALHYLAEPALISQERRWSYLAPLEFLWPSALPQVIAALANEEYAVRSRAIGILRELGPTAVPALAGALREGTDWHILHNARELLAELDPAALELAEQERESLARGLSPAGEGPEGERGLSRAEGDDG
ncbi:MAG: hypothetical protein HYU66_00865 [Armatimonadetes bacterium]|nr:hypothetical protein [Armatimonadota bacterium]